MLVVSQVGVSTAVSIIGQEIRSSLGEKLVSNLSGGSRPKQLLLTLA